MNQFRLPFFSLLIFSTKHMHTTHTLYFARGSLFALFYFFSIQKHDKHGSTTTICRFPFIVPCRVFQFNQPCDTILSCAIFLGRFCSGGSVDERGTGRNLAILLSNNKKKIKMERNRLYERGVRHGFYSKIERLRKNWPCFYLFTWLFIERNF